MFRLIGRLFKGLWWALDLVRRTALNLILLAVLVAVVAVLMRPAPGVPQGAALVLRPTGALVEQAALVEPLNVLRGGGVSTEQAVLPDLLEAINAARDDERITGLVIETDDLSGGGLSKLAELRAAVLAFKGAGKPVLVRGERYTQAQYYLASAADEVRMSSDGFVLLRGLARYNTYFKGALDTLGVKVHVFRVGEYKSFSEPFTRSDMSEEDRESSRDLLDALWNAFRTDVAATRRFSSDVLDGYVTGYRDVLAAAGGDAAKAAKTVGLVDKLDTRDEWHADLIARFGADGSGKDYRQIDTGGYLAAVRSGLSRPPAKVAVLVAQGAIVDGEQPGGSVGGDTFARMIREARESDAVKALVLRIDSPGGSAWASELIRRELELTRRAGKPVIASMSSVAASGGYWIATGADEIWAAPTTLTGSIGIFGIFPEFAEPMKRLGLTVDGVATAPLAGAFDPRRPLDEAAAQAMQLGIEHGYRRFLETVGSARNMSPEDVDKVARGRVWTGEAAAKLGLVDSLGGLDAAVDAAAKRAKLTEYEVVWPMVGASTSQVLLQRLLTSVGLEVPAGPTGSALGQMLDGLQAQAAELLRWNDPQNLYTHCFCEAP
ncbi:signal peptide peptidase SppA [Azoarcus indigens]|uniref:Protease-4 n=1 Tax=Azoarcus indigens TaxID=29545 RepID=A0A4R6DQ23_9RHOO|nr:signal peptide peptidase SppA [Azoarcus indigens]NMG68053.1 signal peptide peptidase SppA [Azoarcus indigens]TDN47047.1 protease-4 [Azoarcus indigens]